ncbi:hypothetical protein RRG08_007524 [Elysia crispata]|uniref:Uncharacterized protein n=1 Tax=Elysia crispata TaxID=231223 RepID=A0AAE0YYG9_9GAST|nr:hypothetical protein RRG08_007524 [Elysia crispata]
MSSQLRVLLVGSDEWMAETGNALLGREAFSLPQSQAQRATVRLPEGRSLQVTAAYCDRVVTGSDNVKCLSEELVSNITSATYHAVIFLMEIQSNLSLSYATAAKCMMKDKSWKRFVKRKGVIVVIGADNYREAQNDGKITVSLIEWLRKKGGIQRTLLQEMQERCLLFDNNGWLNVLNKQRDGLIDMIDCRVLGEGHYIDMKFNEAEMLSQKLEKDLGELKQQVQQKTNSLEENSQKTDGSLKDMNNQLEWLKQEVLKENTERIGVIQTIQEKIDKNSKEEAKTSQMLETQLKELETSHATDSQKAAQRSQKLETQLAGLEKAFKQDSEEAARDSQRLEEHFLEIKRQVTQEKIKRKDEKQTNRNHIERIRECYLWERIKSLALSHPQLHPSRIRTPLLMLLLLLLLLLPLLSSLWPVTANSRKKITALDVSSVDLKLEQAVKRIQDIEKHLAGLSILDTIKSQKLKEINETDPNNVSKIRQEMVEQFTELKERLLNETADLIRDIRKNITGRILVWDMIESLPLSLPLIMVLTLLLLLLTPVPLPVPWASLLGASLVALLILQLLLLLVLLGA